MKAITGIIAFFILLGSISAQNKKPVCKPDTLRMKVGDSSVLQIFTNDVDANGDIISLSKVADRWTIPTTGTMTKTAKLKDTGVITMTRAGLISFRAYRTGTFSFGYYCNDGKAGTGSKSNFVIIVKEDTAGMHSFFWQESTYHPGVQIPARTRPCLPKADGHYWAWYITGNTFYHGYLEPDTSTHRFYIKGSLWTIGHPLYGNPISQPGNFMRELSREMYNYIRQYGCKE